MSLQEILNSPDIISKSATLVASLVAAFFSYKSYKLQKNTKSIEWGIKEIENLRNSVLEFCKIYHLKNIYMLKKLDNDQTIHDQEIEYDAEMFKHHHYMLLNLDGRKPLENQLISEMEKAIEARKPGEAHVDELLKTTRTLLAQAAKSVRKQLR